MSKVQRVSDIYDRATVEEKKELRAWFRRALHDGAVDQGSRNEALVKRVMKFSAGMESIVVAEVLRKEKFYARSTRLGDIARKVERIRSTVR